MLELILCAPSTIPSDSGVAFKVTLKAEESGTVYPARAILEVAEDGGAIADGPIDITPWVRITGITINAGSPQVKGVSAQAVAAIFSAARAGDWVNLPPIPVRTGTTITFNCIYNGTGLAGKASLAMPFLPSRFVNYKNVAYPFGPEIIAASDVGDLTSGTPAKRTLEFQDDGIFDLSRMVIGGHLDVAAGVRPGLPFDHARAILVTGISFQGNQDFIVGDAQGSSEDIGVSAGAFSAFRHRNFYNLGYWRAQQGSKLIVTLSNSLGATIIDSSLHVPMVITGSIPPNLGGNADCLPSPCG